jgi:hypothetical protein
MLTAPRERLPAVAYCKPEHAVQRLGETPVDDAIGAP